VNYTIARYLTPNDTDINNKGISPDVPVELTSKDYDEGRGPWWQDPEGPTAVRKPEDLKDIQLKKALEVVHNKLDNKTDVISKAQSESNVVRGN